MLETSYIWRIDDVCPGMDKKKFEKYIQLFESFGIVPLIGLVPDNRDPALIVESVHYDFWSYILLLKEQGLVDIAQHGFQHVLYNTDTSILDKKLGFNGLSEFSGLSYVEQYNKIFEGKAILKKYDLQSDIWIAPAHSFDKNTILALKNNGFKFISDGIGLFPCKINGICFVPQQIWRPRRMPFGCWTVCMHLNNSTDEDFKNISKFLKYGVNSIRFKDAGLYTNNFFTITLNYFFKNLYYLLNKMK